MNFFDVCGISYIMESIRPQEKESAKEYAPDEIAPKKYSFRPQTLEQYVGQERPKMLIRLNLKKIMTTKPVHFIISGSKGTGKSTLAYIIANQLSFPIKTYIGGAFTMDNLQDFLIENSKSETPSILFVDEIHGINKNIGEFMFPLLEDFLLPIGNVEVRPFIFIGATTEKNTLYKRLAPMIDRCQSVDLEYYNAEDIEKILRQYNEQVYQEKIPDEVYKLISNNCRYTPRLALSLVDDYNICKDIKKILDMHQIVKNSLSVKDIIVLKHLAEMEGKPVGIEVLSVITQQTRADYRLLQEAFLLQSGMLSRTSRGRVITLKGKELLQGLKNDKII